MFPVNSVFRLALLGLRCSGLIVPPQNIKTGMGFHGSLLYLRFVLYKPPCPLTKYYVSTRGTIPSCSNRSRAEGRMWCTGPGFPVAPIRSCSSGTRSA